MAWCEGPVGKGMVHQAGDPEFVDLHGRRRELTPKSCSLTSIHVRIHVRVTAHARARAHTHAHAHTHTLLGAGH